VRRVEGGDSPDLQERALRVPRSWVHISQDLTGDNNSL
jgi:hypothetical protein